MCLNELIFYQFFYIACDAAGPEFLIYDARVTQRNAAQNVQCIHTSMIGTMSRDCDQDWIMGLFSSILKTFTLSY